MKIINGEMHIEEIEQLLKDYLTELVLSECRC